MKPLDPCATPDQQKITKRALAKRGLALIRYRSEDEVRHGWIVAEEGSVTRIQLIGEERVRRVKGDERRFIQVLTP